MWRGVPLVSDCPSERSRLFVFPPSRCLCRGEVCSAVGDRPPGPFESFDEVCLCIWCSYYIEAYLSSELVGGRTGDPVGLSLVIFFFEKRKKENGRPGLGVSYIRIDTGWSQVVCVTGAAPPCFGIQCPSRAVA